MNRVLRIDCMINQRNVRRLSISDVATYATVPIFVVRLDKKLSQLHWQSVNHSKAPRPAPRIHSKPPGNAGNGHSSTMCFVFG